MRPAIIIARMATRSAWSLTRLDRRPGSLVPPVLCYHRVLPQSEKSRRQVPYSVTPDQFRKQLSILASDGFVTLTLQEYYEAAAGLRELPDRSVLITFDDGYNDNHALAWPIVQEFGMKLNLFVCTGLINGERIQVFDHTTPADRASREEFPDLWRPLLWSELNEMKTAGTGLGFHSHSHRNLGTMAAEEIAADATVGISLFKKHLGLRPRSFAFPFGHYGSYSSQASSILRRQGLEMFFTTELGRTAPGNSQQLFPRIVVHPEDDAQSFRRKLYGGYDWVGRIRKLNYSVRVRARKWAEAGF